MFGLANMFEFLNEVKQISPELEVAGIAVTKVDTRKSYYKQTMDTLHELENIHVFEQVIRVDSAIEWSQDNSIPVVEYKKSSRSAKEYTQLAEEVMEAMPVGKGSIQRAASAGAKKTTTRKKAVKTTVLTPQDAEELEAAFVTEEQERANRWPCAYQG